MAWKTYDQPYQPGQKEPYKISRTKIELFTQCQRCFWLDVRMKIKRPSSPPFNINKAIDELFKKEFDVYRKKGKPHPLMVDNNIDAVPYLHDDLDKWRENFTGITTLQKITNLHVFGAVDDVWIDAADNLIVVDYKATAKNTPVTSLGPEGNWQDMYRRQMEVYQWLFRQNDFKVSDTGYFVYATGTTDREGFNNVIDFETHIFPYTGNTEWIEPTLLHMKEIMDSDKMPSVGVSAMGGECEHCAYARARTELTLKALQGAAKPKN